jgi:xanthine phosphoribosyltransferase
VHDATIAKQYYPYEEFRRDLRALTQKIDRPFDTILPIARGGLTMGHMLGEHYSIRKVYAINSVGYDDVHKLERVWVFNIPDLSSSKSVLIVDDIVDSGDTMIEVLEVLHERFPQVTFFTASIFYKSSAKIKPDWYVKETKEWIDFFWSVDL